MSHASGNGGDFDPRQAAALLDQATQRGQQPYTGDISGWAIAVAVVLVAINMGSAAFTAWWRRHGMVRP